MSDQPEQLGTRDGDVLKPTALYAAIAAALMLYFGYARAYDIASGSPLYVSSVFATNWVLRIGGWAMLAAAVLCWIGLRFALLFDALASAAIGASLLIIAAIWMANGDMEGFLFIIFGGMFVSAAWHSWNAYAAVQRPRTELPVRTAPQPASVEEESRRENARERLLQTKANLRLTEQPKSAAARLSTASPSTEPSAAPEAASAAVSSPVPAATPPAADIDASPADAGDEGFLAELGREDNNARG